MPDAVYNIEKVREAYNAQQAKKRQAAYERQRQQRALNPLAEVAPIREGGYRYAKEIWNTHLIVKGDNDAELFKVPYTVGADGASFTFGKEAPVTQQYVELSHVDEAGLLGEWDDSGRQIGVVLDLADSEHVPSSGRKDANWVSKTGGLPEFINRIAKDLMEKGMSESHAIATAVNQCKKWAAGGKDVKPDTRAKAAAAVAEWEAKKARAHANLSTPTRLDSGRHGSVSTVDLAAVLDRTAQIADPGRRAAARLRVLDLAAGDGGRAVASGRSYSLDELATKRAKVLARAAAKAKKGAAGSRKTKKRAGKKSKYVKPPKRVLPITAKQVAAGQPQWAHGWVPKNAAARAAVKADPQKFAKMRKQQGSAGRSAANLSTEAGVTIDLAKPGQRYRHGWIPISGGSALAKAVKGTAKMPAKKAPSRVAGRRRGDLVDGLDKQGHRDRSEALVAIPRSERTPEQHLAFVRSNAVLRGETPPTKTILPTGPAAAPAARPGPLTSTATHRVEQHGIGEFRLTPKSRDKMVSEALNPKSKYHVPPKPGESRPAHVARVRNHVDRLRGAGLPAGQDSGSTGGMTKPRTTADNPFAAHSNSVLQEFTSGQHGTGPWYRNQASREAGKPWGTMEHAQAELAHRKQAAKDRAAARKGASGPRKIAAASGGNEVQIKQFEDALRQKGDPNSKHGKELADRLDRLHTERGQKMWPDLTGEQARYRSVQDWQYRNGAVQVGANWKRPDWYTGPDPKRYQGPQSPGMGGGDTPEPPNDPKPDSSTPMRDLARIATTEGHPHREAARVEAVTRKNASMGRAADGVTPIGERMDALHEFRTNVERKTMKGHGIKHGDQIEVLKGTGNIVKGTAHVRNSEIGVHDGENLHHLGGTATKVRARKISDGGVQRALDKAAARPPRERPKTAAELGIETGGPAAHPEKFKPGEKPEVHKFLSSERLQRIAADTSLDPRRQANAEQAKAILAKRGKPAASDAHVALADARAKAGFPYAPRGGLSSSNDASRRMTERILASRAAKGDEAAKMAAKADGRPGMRADAAKGGPLTDEPGKVTKLTGPNSVSSPGGGSGRRLPNRAAKPGKTKTGLPVMAHPTTPDEKMAALRTIVAGQAHEITGVAVDMQTANVALKVLEALSPANRERMLAMPFHNMLRAAWKLVK